MSEQPETESQSFEDRMAAKLDPSINQPDEPEEQQADDEVASTEPEFEEVDFEGERYQIPVKLKDGLMRQADYTRKTTEVATKAEQLEIATKLVKTTQLQHQFRESVKAEVEQVAMIDAYLKQPVDWSNLTTDDMLRKRAEIDQLKDRRLELQASLSSRENEFTTKIRGEHEKLVKDVNDFLAKRIPGWSADTAKDVAEWAKGEGFTAEELQSIVDPRHALTLYKARQYDKLVADRDNAARTARQAPSLGKPGSQRPMPGDVKAKLNYAKALERHKQGSALRDQAVKDRIAQKFR